MNGHTHFHNNDDDDDDTLDGASTFASISMAIAEDGSCPRHPHVMLKEVGPDGYVYQKEFCPACDKEFKSQKLALKDRKKELDRQLQQLGEEDDDVPSVTEESSVMADDIDNLRDTLMQHASHDKRRSMTDEEVNHAPAPPPPVAAAAHNHNSSMMRTNHMDDQGYSRPPLTLESLANQMNMMQQMQDWILRQKETEMNLLRTKVEAQQKELLQKEVEVALLKQKLDQQEERMQQELKLLKMAASEHRRLSKSSSSKGNKEIHIQELHVSVGGNLNDSNGDLDPKMVQAATQAATTAALENAANAANHNDYRSSTNVKVPAHVRSVNGNAAPPPPTTTRAPSSIKPPPKQKNRVVPLTPSSAAPPRSSQMATQQESSKTVSTKNNATTKSIDGNKNNSAAPIMAAAAIGGTAAVVATNNNNNNKEFTYVPSPVAERKELISFTPEASSSEGEETEGGDIFDVDEAPWVAGAAGVAATKSKVAPAAFSKNMGPLLSQPPINPNPNRKEPLKASTRSLMQPGGAGGGQLNSGPTGLPSKSQVGNPMRGIPLSLNVDDEAPPAVPLEEDVTIGTYDQRAFESRYGHDTMDERSVGATSIGNTVASSTYGEDRQKVVSQTLLDPYGDKGRYSGVVLRSTGMPHGLGRMVYEDDGRTYEGDWRHGRWHGYGRATFANGDSYEGEYRFDQRHGRGKYCWSDGRIYDGEFSEDKRHGKGNFQWPDRATYQGDFHQGQREGHGRYTFSDGGYYTGSWVDGRYEGFGGKFVPATLYLFSLFCMRFGLLTHVCLSLFTFFQNAIGKMDASTRVNGELVWLTDKVWRHTPTGAFVTMASGLTTSPFVLVSIE
jgi:hypothetical protein